MDKQNVACLFSGILFNHKVKQSTEICYNMSELWKHFSKWKKPVIKDHIWYGFVYMKCPEEANLERQEI